MRLQWLLRLRSLMAGRCRNHSEEIATSIALLFGDDCWETGLPLRRHGLAVTALFVAAIVGLGVWLGFGNLGLFWHF
ncbi:hypothetical protein TIFTF001_022463 [Ficus carica]|uniref:Uncharacterized protein n=1 Tax=Ficus carica TaxID=3494 RepID=A0AA88AM20_FICCA|nr:hypothetical protein TIFTF001_022463 [Ficus carica]